MKKVPLLLAILLAVVNFTAAQTQSTDRSAVRSPVVGPNKASNHAENPRPPVVRQPAPSSASALDANSESANVESPDRSQPTWGNTVVSSNSAPLEKPAPTKQSSIASNAPSPSSQNSRSQNRLVQPTALVTEEASVRIIAPGNRSVHGSATANAVPSAAALAPGAIYRVGVGDVLDIRLANMPSRESTLFTVLKGGVVEYPLLNGPVAVAGLTTDEIARLLSREIKVIQSPRVTVGVRDYASHGVVVTGLVDNPGRKSLRREAMPLYTVLAEAQPRPEAAMATIVRNGKEELFGLNDEKAMSTLVVASDVIKISGEPAIQKRFVYIGGGVASPGEKEFRDGMTLTQALLAAGGVSHNTNNSVKVARRNQNGFLVATEYNLRAIADGKSPDPFLQAGDRIEVTSGVW